MSSHQRVAPIERRLRCLQRQGCAGISFEITRPYSKRRVRRGVRADCLAGWTGRCLCLLCTFPLPSSFCDNKYNHCNKWIKGKKTTPFTIAASKSRSAGAMRTQAQVALHPLSPGTCKDSCSTAASGRFWEQASGSRNTNLSPTRSQPKGGPRRVSDHSFVYTPWLLIWYFYTLCCALRTEGKKKWINQVNVLY